VTPTIDQTFAGRSVLVTGHTGFKGSWLSLWLHSMGAKVAGFSDQLPTDPCAFELCSQAPDFGAGDHRGEISDLAAVKAAMEKSQPSVVFHLAAQPIVRAGFSDPYTTFATNVMGTAAVLEACRMMPSVEAVVVVTSDKVYDNTGSPWAFRETDRLGGHEPYGASKAAAEIVAMTYQSAGFHGAAGSLSTPRIATARAGNVIGGGDWAADRLIPDFVRAIAEGRDQKIRQPRATRPWQHVLEPIGGYLLLAHALLSSPETTPEAINFGPIEATMPDVEEVATLFLDAAGATKTKLIVDEDKNAGEAKTLRVDSSLAGQILGWTPSWTAREAIARTADWYRAHLDGSNDLRELSLAQLADYRRATPVAALKG